MNDFVYGKDWQLLIMIGDKKILEMENNTKAVE